MFTKEMGRAMSLMVERHNTDPEHLQRRIAELEAENDRLRKLLRESKNQISESPYTGDKQLYDGRPVITPSEASRMTRVSKSTVCRYIQSGHWDGVQLPGTNRWLVFTDRGLPIKTRGKRH